MCITIPRILIRAQGTEEAEENWRGKCVRLKHLETGGEKFLSVSAFLLTLIHDIVSILSVRQTKKFRLLNIKPISIIFACYIHHVVMLYINK